MWYFGFNIWLKQGQIRIETQIVLGYQPIDWGYEI